MKIIVQDNQTIIDIAVLHCGDVDRMIDIVEANTLKTVNDLTGDIIDLSKAIVPGTELEISDTWINKKVTKEIAGGLGTAV